MKTEYAIGNIRIRFESRARRRWLVALFYVAVVLICLAWCSFNPKGITGAWILSGCMVLGVAFALIFSWVGGDMRAAGDEREMHRRGQAYFRAYSLFGKIVVAALVAAGLFRWHNPMAPLLPLVWWGGMVNWYSGLFLATGILYLTLPQAILLWTEPDMDLNLEAATQ